jgi:tetratricopeptide (TPR) repeat protein
MFSLVFGSTTPAAGNLALDELADDIARSAQSRAVALASRAAFASMEGAHDDARLLANQAIEIEESLGAHLVVAIALEFLARVEFEAGDAVAAERHQRRRFEILDEGGYQGFASTAAADLAWILWSLDRFDEAERYAGMARSLAADDDIPSQTIGASVQGLVLAERGGFDEAEHLAREAVGMLRDAQAEWPQGEGDLRLNLARVLRIAGKPADAEGMAREALACYERKGDRTNVATTQAFLAGGR